MITLLTQIAIGAVIGAFAYCFVNPLIWRWLERHRGLKPVKVIMPRELVVATLVGVLAYMASYMGPLKSGGLKHAYNDLCGTLSADSLSGVIGQDYADSATGQYLAGAFEDNCQWAE